MNSILEDTEKAYKEMIRMWTVRMNTIHHGKQTSYQKFRVLKMVSSGHDETPDIAYAAGLDHTTTLRILHSLHSDLLLFKGKRGQRKYIWSITTVGKKRLKEMQNVQDSLLENFRDSLKKNLEIWM